MIFQIILGWYGGDEAKAAMEGEEVSEYVEMMDVSWEGDVP